MGIVDQLREAALAIRARRLFTQKEIGSRARTLAGRRPVRRLTRAAKLRLAATGLGAAGAIGLAAGSERKDLGQD